jgi:hypothetical protein
MISDPPWWVAPFTAAQWRAINEILEEQRHAKVPDPQLGRLEDPAPTGPDAGGETMPSVRKGQASLTVGGLRQSIAHLDADLPVVCVGDGGLTVFSPLVRCNIDGSNERWTLFLDEPV